MRILAFLGLVSFLSISLYAQTWEAGGTPDTVTVGSRVMYQVTPDANLVGDPNMNASQFDWIFTDVSDVPITTGISVTESPDGTTGYYVENTINVTYAAETYGSGASLKVKTTEVSQPKYGTGCSGNQVEINVHFVAVPSVAVNGTSGGGCGISTWDIPLTITGYGPFDVTFTVAHDGTAIGGGAKTIGAVANNADDGAHTLNLTLTDADYLDQGTGAYEIVITDIVDRFSGKSTIAIAGSVDGANDTYTIGVNPTPNTQPIQHLRNL